MNMPKKAPGIPVSEDTPENDPPWWVNEQVVGPSGAEHEARMVLDEFHPETTSNPEPPAKPKRPAPPQAKSAEPVGPEIGSPSGPIGDPDDFLTNSESTDDIQFYNLDDAAD